MAEHEKSLILAEKAALDSKYISAYSRLLAVETEKSISDFARGLSERAGLECPIAEKAIEISHYYT